MAEQNQQATAKVEFTEDVHYDGGGIPTEARDFEKDEVYELPIASAAHWVDRNKATYVGGPKKDAPAAPARNAVAPQGGNAPQTGDGPANTGAGPSTVATTKTAKAATHGGGKRH